MSLIFELGASKYGSAVLVYPFAVAVLGFKLLIILPLAKGSQSTVTSLSRCRKPYNFMVLWLA